VTGFNLRGEGDVQHIVGGMSGGHQHTTPVSGLEQRAFVDACGHYVLLQGGDEVDHGAASVENLGVRFTESAFLGVELAAFDVHADNVDTVFGRADTLAIVRHVMDNSEVVNEGINGDGVLSGVVLHSTGQESVSEEELVNPQAVWDTAGDPFVEELKSFFEILDVTSKGLERGETLGNPHSGNLAIGHGNHSIFKVLRHEDFSDNSAFHVLQTRLDGLDEDVEARQFLGEDSVHGLVVIDGVVLLGLPLVVLSGHILDDVVGQRNNSLLLVRASAISSSLHGG